MVASGKMAPVPPVLIQEDAADSDDEDGADFTVGLFASAADTKVRLTPQLLFLPPPLPPTRSPFSSSSVVCLLLTNA